MTLLWLVLVTLAAWRITSVLARERGVFGVGMRLRSFFGVYHNDDGSPAVDADGNMMLNSVTRWAKLDDLLHEVAMGITCVWCCSIWVSFALTLALVQLTPALVHDSLTYVVAAMAMSAGVIGLEKVLT